MIIILQEPLTQETMALCCVTTIQATLVPIVTTQSVATGPTVTTATRTTCGAVQNTFLLAPFTTCAIRIGVKAPQIKQMRFQFAV